MIHSKEFGERIKKIMEFHDLNASSFAEEINVGRSSISHILSGRNKPSLDLVMSILTRFTDVDIYWLLNGKGSYPNTLNTIPEKIHTTNIGIESSNTITDDSNEPTETIQQPNLFSTPEAPVLENNMILKKGKKVTRVLFFYDDDTFKEYLPE